MSPEQVELLRSTIKKATGGDVDVILDGAASRRTLVAYFSDYTKNQGPRFKLSGYGLKRHKVAIDFGTYARSCIDAMRDASPEQYQVARSLVEQVKRNHEVEITGCADANDWTIEEGFRLETSTKPNSSPYEDAAIVETVLTVMVPLIGAMAELMGYQEAFEGPFETEGKLFEATVRRRERSTRNRLLCLAIHGASCAVCGTDPQSRYGGISIVEVHHLEALHTLDAPRPYDPRTDLVPICPNCHRAIHSRFPAYGILEMKAILNG